MSFVFRLKPVEKNCTILPKWEAAVRTLPDIQRWAKGQIDRSSDTDSIFRLYRTIQSVDAKFRFLNRPIVSVRFEFRFFNRPILFLGLNFRFLYRPIVSVRFEFRFLNHPILFFGFKFRFFYVRLYWPVLSNKTNAVKMVGNGLAGPSKMDFVETIRLLYVRFCIFEG